MNRYTDQALHPAFEKQVQVDYARHSHNTFSAKNDCGTQDKTPDIKPAACAAEGAARE